MSKMDDFKKFVSKRPYLKDKINAKETTWQELYEHYDLYGEDDDIFKERGKEKNDNKKKEDNKDSTVNGLFDMLNGIDIDKIADGLNGMKKVLGILGELTQFQQDTKSNIRKAPSQRNDD